MGYKWKPNATQRKAFAKRMQDPEEQQAYSERKEVKATKRRAASKFDYDTAGGHYTPTEAQYNFCMNISTDLTIQQETACNQVIFGYTCKEKIHHDEIHIVNELMRA